MRAVRACCYLQRGRCTKFLVFFFLSSIIVWCNDPRQPAFSWKFLAGGRICDGTKCVWGKINEKYVGQFLIFFVLNSLFVLLGTRHLGRATLLSCVPLFVLGGIRFFFGVFVFAMLCVVREIHRCSRSQKHRRWCYVIWGDGTRCDVAWCDVMRRNATDANETGALTSRLASDTAKISNVVSFHVNILCRRARVCVLFVFRLCLCFVVVSYCIWMGPFRSPKEETPNRNHANMILYRLKEPDILPDWLIFHAYSWLVNSNVAVGHNAGQRQPKSNILLHIHKLWIFVLTQKMYGWCGV